MESKEDEPAFTFMLQGILGHAVHPSRLSQLSREFWGFLNLNLTEEARQPLEIVQNNEGFEVWRRSMKTAHSRCEVRRLELNGRVQRPDPASKSSDLQAAFDKWDTNMRQYIEAGGTPLTYDQKRGALVGILPSSIQAERGHQVDSVLGHRGSEQ